MFCDVRLCHDRPHVSTCHSLAHQSMLRLVLRGAPRLRCTPTRPFSTASVPPPSSAPPPRSGPSTVDAAEVSKFVRMASEWWSLDGKFAPLHAQNPTRVSFIREHAMTHFKKTDFVQPLAGLAVADIGCGGGLLSEPLARLGATVTGIDAAPENIGIAQAHQNQDPVLMSPGRLTYRAITAEDLLQREGGEKFDIVCAMEIIEHVSDISLFVDCITKLLKPGGLLFVSTLNRTPKAYAMAILGAEHILRWIPAGTHDFHKFVTPAELTAHMHRTGLAVRQMNGIVLNPLSLPPWTWRLSLSDLDVNYVACSVKPASA